MNLHFFNSSIYQARRAELANLIGDGLILFVANEESGINYRDNTYPFRQDSNVLYYSGIDRAGISILIDAKEGQSYLMGDEASMDDVVWTGPVPSLQELAMWSGIENIITQAQGENLIKKTVTKGLRVHYLPVYRGDHSFKLGSLLGKTPESIASDYSIPLAKAVVQQREIKSNVEITQLEQAIEVSGQMHRIMMTKTKAGMQESEVMAAVRSHCLAANLDIPYSIILSVDGQTLHNHSYHNVMKPGQLLLGDFGSDSHMHYAGDITRTIPVAATFSSFQKDIYNIVLDTLNKAIQAVKAGTKYLDIHLAAAKNIAQSMTQLGFLSGDPDDLVALGAHALFFPHGLGHALGLDVHDMESIGEEYTGYTPDMTRSNQFGLRSLRLAKSLRSGMVLTVEPGIYFIPELISQWKAQGKFKDHIQYDKIERMLPFGGIRIEDNVLVEDQGSKILGPPIPKEIKDVEELRQQAYL